MSSKLTLFWVGHPRRSVGVGGTEHIHRYHQLYYVVKGSPVFVLNDIEIQTCPGSLFYIPPYIPHNMLPIKDGPMECWEFKIQITDPFLLSHLKDIRAAETCDQYTVKLLDYVRENWRCKDAQHIENAETILTTVLLSFFIKELKYDTVDTGVISSQGYNKITKDLMFFIETNTKKNITLDMLSNQFNYNGSYLSTVFSQNTGYSIMDFLNLLRIRTAIILLGFYSIDVFSSCETSGFSNPSYFSRTFKKMVGVSPSKFKRFFMNGDKQLIEQLFLNEPHFNFNACTIDEAFKSLENIGRTINDYYDKQKG